MRMVRLKLDYIFWVLNWICLKSFNSENCIFPAHPHLKSPNFPRCVTVHVQRGEVTYQRENKALGPRYVFCIHQRLQGISGNNNRLPQCFNIRCLRRQADSQLDVSVNKSDDKTMLNLEICRTPGKFSFWTTYKFLVKIIFLTITSYPKFVIYKMECYFFQIHLNYT